MVQDDQHVAFPEDEALKHRWVIYYTKGAINYSRWWRSDQDVKFSEQNGVMRVWEGGNLVGTYKNWDCVVLEEMK